MMWLLTAALCAIVLFCLILWFRQSNRGLPAGPTYIFGNIFGSNSREAKKNLLELKSKYGEICCIRVLGTPCIYLNSHARIRQFFVAHGDVFSGRLNFTGVKHRVTAGRGIVLGDGLSWQEHRRFVLSTLRDFGFGRGATEQIIQNELLQLTEHLQSYGGKTVDPRLALNMATCNVICSLVFGERCGNDPGFEAVYKMVSQNLDNPLIKQHELVLLRLFKVTASVPAIFWPRFLRNFDGVCDFLERKLEEHKQSFNGEVRDVIDAYLKELRGQSDDVNSHETFCDKELLRTILDLFVAGMETTASTLRWGLYLMAQHQDVQKRVQSELHEVLQQRLPNSADRKQLVYLEAVLMELQRYVTLAPVGALPHRCTEQVQLEQFVIPKDTLVFANLFAVHHDQSMWPHAAEFNPNNFYDETNNSLKNSEHLIPFNVGRRSCLGESLAKQELFILFAGLLQKFEVLQSADHCWPDENCGRFGRLRIPPKFEVLMKLRDGN